MSGDHSIPAGEGEAMNHNRFPHYTDGDVLIILSKEYVYQLHSSELCRKSKFFCDRLTGQGAVLSEEAKRKGETIRWRFDMVERPRAGEVGVGRLERVVSLSQNCFAA